MYTCEDAAKALRMIFSGLIVLVVFLASSICSMVGYCLLWLVKHPLHVLGGLACGVLLALFVPSLVALAWLIC